jgi:hypothetical protein
MTAVQGIEKHPRRGRRGPSEMTTHDAHRARLAGAALTFQVGASGFDGRDGRLTGRDRGRARRAHAAARCGLGPRILNPARIEYQGRA